MDEKDKINDTIINDIVEKIHGMELGSITISIFNSKIVQVDITTTQKKRYDDVWMLEEGGGI